MLLFFRWGKKKKHNVIIFRKKKKKKTTRKTTSSKKAYNARLKAARQQMAQQREKERAFYAQPDKPKVQSGAEMTLSQKLVLLYIAPNYKVNETKYPDYVSSRFGITIPKAKYTKLANENLIRESTNHESLSHLKVAELKEIASDFSVAVSGKKDTICNQIQVSILDEQLNKYKIPHYWILTESGKQMLEDNPYVELFMGKHKYSLEDANIGIEEVAELAQNRPMARCRDAVWGLLNKKSGESFEKGTTTGNFRTHCNQLRTMALFLEEEGKYKPALDQYYRYLFYQINYESALKGMHFYSTTQNIESSADCFINGAELVPFQIAEISDLVNENCYSEDDFKDSMLECFSKEPNKGLLTPNELVEFINCSMRGDREQMRAIYKKIIIKNKKRL